MNDTIKNIPSLADLRAQRDQIISLAEKYGAYNIRVFGSVARGEANPDSDVDFLVTFRDGASLFEQSGLWQDLQALLGCEVNVLSEGGLKPHFRKQIEQDLTTL